MFRTCRLLSKPVIPLSNILIRKYASVSASPVVVSKSQSGITVVSVEEGAPASSVAVIVKAGPRAENANSVGAAHFLKNFAFKETQKRTSFRTIREAELLGGVLSANLTRETLIYSAEFLREDLSLKYLYLSLPFYDILPNAEPLPEVIALNAAHSVAFRHGLGNSLYANESTKVTYIQDVIEYAKKVYTAPNITIVGTSVDHKELLRLTNELFQNISHSVPSTPIPSKYYGGEERIPAKGTSHYVLAFAGAPANTPDFLVLQVLRSLLDGEKHTRWGEGVNILANKFKDTKISTFNIGYSDAGLFGIYFSGVPTSIYQAARMAVEQLKHAVKNVSEEDFSRALAKARYNIASAYEERASKTEIFGNQILSTGKVIPVEEAIVQLDQIKVQDLQNIATKILQSKPTTVALEKELSPPPLQRRSTGNSPMNSNNIENTVTQLLFTTKSLLEALTSWSLGRMNEQQVSDIYVQLGSELNVVVNLFNQSGVDMSNIAIIPQELRVCLEKTLTEEASPATLEQHLPSIKEIIVSLLQGLKAKQVIYRQITNSESSELTNYSNTNVKINPSDPMVDALKRVNLLERKASKRHSVYTMQRGTGRRNITRRNREGLIPPQNDIQEEEDFENNVENDKEAVDLNHGMSNEVDDTTTNDQESRENNPLTLYLQLGKDVKKIKYDGDISIPALRMLFIEKFQYNPGLDDFPNIYIKDPKIGILYELEDLGEVKNNSILSLNVKVLEQVKKHIDQSMAELTKEIRDIKKSITENESKIRNISTPPTPSATQFRVLAKKVISNVKDQKEEKGSNKDALVIKIANELKDQFVEVQNLRRDLGIMRQYYTGFQEETNQLIKSLTTKAENVKLVLKNVSSERKFIDDGKAKLDARTSNLMTKVDDLQDIIDELKADVVKRRAKPRETSVQLVKKESGEIEKELESLHKYVKTVKPMWKKTWEEELQMIVDEQQFLSHQEELIEDLTDDNKKLTQVFNKVLEVGEVRFKSKPKEYFVKEKEEGFEGLKTVLLEVKGIAPDHERRLKALEQSQKARERELANRIDEFEAELTDFVTHSKLKKTGGAQEVERLRQKKNEDVLKELFKSNSENKTS
ncbi:6948_t:CDS:10 [Diversispora eburnea]|uniref:6948_t:CDS:1 n=1 Tax=Diversispora eburnea TaxID=1213867 RepID=A0A9N9AUC4_9GLOM|nr:6948_t:CDS:10 [Diversispora eburnea]